MHGTTADTARYRAVADRFRALHAGLVGGVSLIDTPEASPDGRLVAAILRVRDADEGEGHAELHVVAADGSRTWRVTGEGADAADPRWSRGGTLLTFLADLGSRHRLAPFALEVGPDGPVGDPRRLPSVPGFPELQRPSRDGSRLLVVTAGEHAEVADGLGSGTAGERAAAEAARAKADGGAGGTGSGGTGSGGTGSGAPAPAWTPMVETTDGQDEWRTTWLLDVASGGVRQVSPPGVNTWEADWLGPDAAVAVVTDAPAEDAWFRATLARVDLADGTVTTLHRPAWQIQFAVPSPDGGRAAVIEAVASDRYFVAGRLVMAQADGGGSRELATGDVDVSTARWLDDSRLVAFGREGFDVVAGIAGLDGSWTETWRSEAAEGGSYPAIAPVGPDGDVVLALDGPDDPERLAIVGPGGERPILRSRRPVHDLLAPAAAGQEVVSWTGRDGTRIDGLLRRPAGGGPRPLVLWVHGGPVGATGRFFPSIHAALFAEAGYAVLLPNPRGSTGRGREYAAAVVGDMGGEDAHDLLAGVEWAIAAGVADPARIAVAGVSYGGYMAALLPTLTDRFAAAVVSSPLTDLFSSYWGSSLTVFVDDYIGGDPATDPARYLARSPVFAGSRLRTPTLITAGRRDRATPDGQAVELFRAVRAQGTPAELVLYPTEGHGFSSVATQIDWIARMHAWFGRHLEAAPR